MKFVKLFEEYHLLEKLSVSLEKVIQSFEGEFIPIESLFGELDFSNLEYLSNNFEFIEILKANNLKKSSLKYSKDSETFIETPFKYLTLKDKDKNNLQDPDYIIIQKYDGETNESENCLLYKINGNFNGFYENLTDKYVEINYKNTNYIYRTNNKNTWVLSNQEPTKKFPSTIRKDYLAWLVRKYG